MSASSHLPARDLTRLFRTLSDETRFRLLRLLWREELTVNELSTITQLAQPRISNHLKILREDNLIVERRSGSSAAKALWPTLEETWRENEDFPADDKRLSEVLSARHPDKRLSFFDRLAEQWDEYRNQLFGDALGREILRAFLPPGLVVADIGTGTGYVLTLFGERAEKLIAIDNSEGMLALAREKARAVGLVNIEFRLADAAENALHTNEADVVTVVQVLHHLERPGEVVRHLAAGVRPGGVLIINDFLEHEEHWLRTELQHQWLGFPRDRMEEWLQSGGLRVESWDVLAGRLMTGAESYRLRVPDAFTVVARKPQ
jgi:ArsR family transcriptional regulator